MRESLELKAGSTKLYVQPKPHSGDEIVSACVTPVSVQKLEAPAITIERQVLWETVSGADYYDVYVGGEFYKRVSGCDVLQDSADCGKRSICDRAQRNGDGAFLRQEQRRHQRCEVSKDEKKCHLFVDFRRTCAGALPAVRG